MTVQGDRQFISHYQLEESLGRGAMGTVHLAADTTNGQRVAVKILHPHLTGEESAVRRFVQERNAFDLIQHPNVVRVRDLVAEGEQLAVVMELVDGGDLKEVKDRLRGAPNSTVHLMAQVADGLAAIHGAGVVHRDLKPANILIAGGDEGWTPKIADFGLSQLIGEAVTHSSAAIGTPIYMAPELAEKSTEVSAMADVYALGVILFELLAGEPPFHGGGTMAVLRAHSQDPPPVLGGIPDGLGALIQEMLAKDPAVRPTAEQVRDRLLRLLPEVDNSQVPTIVAVDAAPPFALSAESDQQGQAAAPLVGAGSGSGLMRSLQNPTARLWAGVGSAVVAVGLLALAGFALLSGDDAADAQAGPETEYAFAPSVLEDGAVLTRKWSFNDDGSLLVANVRILSSEGTTVAAEHAEVLPATFGVALADIGFEPSPDGRLDDELTATYAIESLEAGDSFSFFYEVDLPADGDSFERLEAYALDQIEAEQAYYRARGGEAPVAVGVVGITTSPQRVDVEVGESRQVELAGLLSDDSAAPEAALEGAGWQVADPGVATVADGLVTGLSAGTTTIVVQLGEQTATIAVEVTGDGTAVVAGAGADGRTDPAGPGTTENGSGTTDGSGGSTGSTSDTTAAPTTATTDSATTSSSTSTTEEETTTSTTEPPATSAAIRFVSGPSVTSVGTNTFNFAFTTNDVCGGVHFRIFKDGVQQYGASAEQNQCSPNYTQSSTRVAAGLEQGTTYRVEVTITGRSGDGTTPTGTGTATSSFTVTMDGNSGGDPVQVAIVGGPSLSSAGSGKIVFTLTTNDVCSSAGWNVVNVATGSTVASHGGGTGCFGPNHTGDTSWTGVTLEPNTTYRIDITVRGTTGGGTPGTGTASTSFTATTPG